MNFTWSAPASPVRESIAAEGAAIPHARGCTAAQRQWLSCGGGSIAGTRRSWRWLAAFAAAALLLPAAGCRQEPDSNKGQPGASAKPASGSAAGRKVQVVVSILPQKYFVERIGGPEVAVTVLVGPGQSPHAYEPTPRQAAALAAADLFIQIGEPFEARLLDKVRGTFANLKIIDTREGVPLRRMTEEEGQCNHDHAGHDHDHAEHDHAHGAGSPDPHIWLSPRLVKVQAATIAKALCEAAPETADLFRQNLDGFCRELDDVNTCISAMLAPYKDREVFVFHPSYGYFMDEYALRQVAVEREGKEPSPAQLGDLVKRARQAGVRTVFVQPQNPTKGAEALAREIGARVEVIDPYAPDFIHNLREMAEKIRDALQAATPPAG